MYILDEIDAAQDLSHTQHIGMLFRTRFRGMRFFAVSLKEGLFTHTHTHANVLSARDSATALALSNGLRSETSLVCMVVLSPSGRGRQVEMWRAGLGGPRRARRGAASS